MFDFATTSMVGFSGSRAPSSASVRALQMALAALPSDVAVVVGCAAGVDALVRSAHSSARVFRADDYGVGRGALAARSIACVRAVAAAGGVWVSLPDAACPVGLCPSSSASACFAGYGSGSWASLALALGLGVRCFVFLPAGVSVPAGWPLVALAAQLSASLKSEVCRSGNGFTLSHDFVTYIPAINPPLSGKCLRMDELHV